MLDTVSTLRLHLLGHFRLEGPGGPPSLLTRKAESLLAYLVLHPGPHPRERLAALFWGDNPDAHARVSLRSALAALRRALGDSLILADREVAQLNPDVPLWVDALEFERRATAAEPDLAAVDLYQGDLLADFYDEWLDAPRERLRRLYADTLLHRIETVRAEGNYEQAVALARRLLAHDPAHEAAHQHLMACLFALGQREAALKQFEVCQRALAHALGVEPSPATWAIYRRLQREQTVSPTPAARLGNLPHMLTSFIGREREVAELVRLLTGKTLPPTPSPSGRGEGVGTQARVRLLTLTGAGGSGKTRLALQVASAIDDLGLTIDAERPADNGHAARANRPFDDGAWWVDLSPLADPTLVPQAIARALGIRETPGQPLLDTLTAYLRGKSLLLLLDNCEHLILACAQVVETLLHACPDLAVLATSREALHVPGERVWLVPLLNSDEATRLFAERAQAIQVGFRWTPDNAPTIAHICRTLDGIPLAIELAAAQLRYLSLDQVAARLDDRFALLTGGSRATPRHETLRAMMDWSYELLSEPERVLFRRLSVFAGGFSLAAAEATATASQAAAVIPAHRVPMLLSRLIDQSLVTRTTVEEESRYDIYEVLREYAGSQLTQTDERAAVQAQHAAWFVALALQARTAFGTVKQPDWLDRLELEHANLRRALHHLIASGQSPLALKLADALREFWEIRGYWAEGRGWFEQIIAGLDPASLEFARALQGLGNLTGALGYWSAAYDYHQQSYGVYQELNDRLGVAYALYNLGSAALELANNEEARRWLLQSRRLFETLGLPRGLSFVLNNLGRVEMADGEYGTAQHLLEEALALTERAGDRVKQAYVLENLGIIARNQGRLPDAQVYFDQALALWRQLRDRRGTARSLNLLACTLREQGQVASALTLYQESLALFQAVHNLLGMAYTYNALGEVARLAGDYGQAQSHYSHSLALYREVNYEEGTATALLNLGFVALHSGRPKDALAAFQDSLRLFQDRLAKVWSLTGIGVALTLSHPGLAARLLGAVHGLLQTMGVVLERTDQAEYDAALNLLRQTLPPAVFQAEWDVGEQMTLDEAEAVALGAPITP